MGPLNSVGRISGSASASNIQVYRDPKVTAVMLTATLTKADATTTVNARYTLDLPLSNYKGSFAVSPRG